MRVGGQAKFGELEVVFHRTVRVPDGRAAANLPPSLGHVELYSVKKYRDHCPGSWEEEGFFAALHDTEAMWMSFHSPNHPRALLVGAGGVNALTGEKLGTRLETDNYLVTPPQPWLDGWKGKDGTVYQFVATAYKEGEGISVAEQLIGKESKTGAIGLAVFDPKEPDKLKVKMPKREGWSGSMIGDDFNWTHTAGSYKGGSLMKSEYPVASCSTNRVSKSARMMSEMGLGKGGKIIQKVYADPHGLEVWQEKPSATLAVYLVNAHVFEEITGIKVPQPVGYEAYQGHWFGMDDKEEKDVAGSSKFVGLKSAVFPAAEEVEVGKK
jgi:hypothetical protein